MDSFNIFRVIVAGEWDYLNQVEIFKKKFHSIGNKADFLNYEPYMTKTKMLK